MPLLKSSLFTRTALLLLALAIIPAILVSFIQVSIVKKALANDFQNIKARLAERTAKSAVDFISSVTGLLVTIGELDEFSYLRREGYSGVTRRVLESHPIIASIALYDGEGNWVFGMERTPGAIEERDKIGHLSDYLRESVIRNGKFRGATLKAGNYPALELYVPLRRRDSRRVVGFIRGIVSLLALSENLAEGKIGKTAESFIVDQRGRLIAHSGYKKFFREDMKADLEAAIKERLDKLGPYQNWNGSLKLEDGRRVVLALYKLEELPWIAGSFQEEWEAFVVMVAMRQKLAEVILIGAMLALLLALFFASRISSPIRSLTRAVRQIVASDFTQANTEPLPKPANEIGELAGAFESMSRVLAHRTQELMEADQKLRLFNTELEGRVEARTKELKATQSELIKQERLAAIGQMASVVGHELRNPLAVINNSIYVIKNRLESLNTPQAPADPKIVKHVNIVEGELQVANQIITEILTFARTREIQPRDMELHEFLEEIAGRLSLPENVQFVKKYAGRPIPIKIDPDEIRQVLRNLIGNAIDAMPNGGTLTLETKVNGNFAMIFIGDTGMGIPPETLAKIFTPFFTTKSKGTGLGLAVVKKVMDRHNGEAAVESQVGKGTGFTLKLPLS